MSFSFYAFINSNFIFPLLYLYFINVQSIKFILKKISQLVIMPLPYSTGKNKILKNDL